MQWELVDLECESRAKRNDLKAPVYNSGDQVPWDGKERRVKVPRCMRGATRVVTMADRLHGSLAAYRAERPSVG